MYKNFRSMEIEDTIFVNTNNLINSSRQGVAVRGNKKLKRAILYSVAGVAGVIGLSILAAIFIF